MIGRGARPVVGLAGPAAAVVLLLSGCGASSEQALRQAVVDLTASANDRDAGGVRRDGQAVLDRLDAAQRDGAVTPEQAATIRAQVQAVRAAADVIDPAVIARLEAERAAQEEAERLEAEQEAAARAEQERLEAERAAEEQAEERAEEQAREAAEEQAEESGRQKAEEQARKSEQDRKKAEQAEQEDDEAGKTSPTPTASGTTPP